MTQKDLWLLRSMEKVLPFYWMLLNMKQFRKNLSFWQTFKHPLINSKTDKELLMKMQKKKS